MKTVKITDEHVFCGLPPANVAVVVATFDDLTVYSGCELLAYMRKIAVSRRGYRELTLAVVDGEIVTLEPTAPEA